MSRGISRLQQTILEVISIPGEPEGLPRGVIQAQLWPSTFGHDYRFTSESGRIVKEKNKCRVVLSRAISSLIRRGLVKEAEFDRVASAEVQRRGLILPYKLKLRDGRPNYGDAFGRFLVRV